MKKSNRYFPNNVFTVLSNYSVEIENAEIILDIDTPDDFITAKERYTEI